MRSQFGIEYIIDDLLKFSYEYSLGNDSHLFALAYKRDGTGASLVGTWRSSLTIYTVFSGEEILDEKSNIEFVVHSDGTYTLSTTINRYDIDGTLSEEPAVEVKNGEYRVSNGILEMKDSVIQEWEEMDYLYTGSLFAYGNHLTIQ